MGRSSGAVCRAANGAVAVSGSYAHPSKPRALSRSGSRPVILGRLLQHLGSTPGGPAQEWTVGCRLAFLPAGSSQAGDGVAGLLHPRATLAHLADARSARTFGPVHLS